jgi:Cu2+-containing amine oxidase
MSPRALRLVAVLALLFAHRARAQSCSAPYLVEQQFPTVGTEQTRWRICWTNTPGYGLVITSAHFRKTPTSPWMRVFWDARIGEIFVPYHNNSHRYADLSMGFPLGTLTSADCPASAGGTLLGTPSVTCKEVHARGLAWKTSTRVYRGEELLVWGAIMAANYIYIMEWTFRDDGVIMGRFGATGSNLPGPNVTTAHMHNAMWRLDIDLDGWWGDAVHQGIHTETGLTATDTDPAVATETGLQWNDEAFGTLQIHDATLKNARGDPTSYHLIPTRMGSARHQEPWTQNDFWVTYYDPAQMRPESLPSYVSPPANINPGDIVVWYWGSVHHLIRDEDGQVINGYWDGVAQLMWTGFMLKPHNLFDRPPLY